MLAHKTRGRAALLYQFDICTPEPLDAQLNQHASTRQDSEPETLVRATMKDQHTHVTYVSLTPVFIARAKFVCLGGYPKLLYRARLWWYLFLLRQSSRCMRIPWRVFMATSIVVAAGEWHQRWYHCRQGHRPAKDVVSQPAVGFPMNPAR
jgi:hypothetical protein